MKHEEYKTSLFQGKAAGVVGHIIRSYDHELYSEKVRKMALCPFDDKRYVKNDGITTLAHGHYSIEKTLPYLCNHSTTVNMSTSLELMLDETKAMDVVFKDNYKVCAFAQLSNLEPEWELQLQHIRQLWNAV